MEIQLQFPNGYINLTGVVAFINLKHASVVVRDARIAKLEIYAHCVDKSSKKHTKLHYETTGVNETTFHNVEGYYLGWDAG